MTIERARGKPPRASGFVLVATRGVGMGLAVAGAGDTELLLSCDGPGQAATEHRKRQHEQQFLREHAASPLLGV
jgi:hypothetical protein